MTWGPQMTEVPPSVYSIAVTKDVVYVGGNFTLMGGQSRRGLAALDAAAGQVTDWNPKPSGAVNAVASDGGSVLVGGSFTSLASESRANVAALDLATGRVTSWNPGADGSVTALTSLGNTIYACGTFHTLAGQARERVGAVDALTGAATAFDAGGVRSLDVPQALSVHQVRLNALITTPNAVYLGGRFNQVGGQARYALAALDPVSGACLPWNVAMGGDVYALASSGGTLYIGGLFSSAGGLSRSSVAAVDEQTAAVLPWNPQADWLVDAIAVGSNQVYLGEDFANVGGQPPQLPRVPSTRPRVSRWRGTPGPMLPSPASRSTRTWCTWAVRSRRSVAAPDPTLHPSTWEGWCCPGTRAPTQW